MEGLKEITFVVGTPHTIGPGAHFDPAGTSGPRISLNLGQIRVNANGSGRVRSVFPWLDVDFTGPVWRKSNVRWAAAERVSLFGHVARPHPRSVGGQRAGWPKHVNC